MGFFIVSLSLLVAALFYYALSFHNRLTALENSLKNDYWTKKVIARNYGEPPADKLVAEKKQDKLLAGNQIPTEQLKEEFKNLTSGVDTKQ